MQAARAWLAARFELARGAGSNLPAMEGLRGFAVFLVFLHHYITFTSRWFPAPGWIHAAARAVFYMGAAGVDLFFVLSGFVIYGALIQRPQDYWPFLRRRLRRLYPAFTAVFLVYLAASFVVPGESKIPPSPGAAAVFLVANFLMLPGLFPITAMITVAWSLSYELAYYVVMPVVVATAGLRAWTASGRVAFIASAAVFGGVVSAIVDGPTRLMMFAAGMVLFEVMRAGWWAAPSSGVGLAALVVGLAASTRPAPDPVSEFVRVSILVPATLVAFHACFGRPLSAIARAFSWTPLRWLGNMSYSYYLIHGLTLKAAFMLLGVMGMRAGTRPLWAAVLFVPMFGLTLLPAAALYLAVERPLSLTARRPSGD